MKTKGLLFCLLCSLWAYGQPSETPVLSVPLGAKGAELFTFATFASEIPQNASLLELQKAEFRKFDSTVLKKTITQAWLRLIIDNQSKKQEALNVVFKYPVAFVSVFKGEQDSLVLIQNAGNRATLQDLHFRFVKNWLQIPLLVHKIDTIYFRMSHRHLNFREDFATIYAEKTLPESLIIQQFNSREPNRWFNFFLLGFSFLMTIFLFFKSAVNNWERANLYCSLTFLCCFFNVWLWSETIDFPSPEQTGRLGLWFNQLVPIMMLLLYRAFLAVRHERPMLYKFMTAAIVVLFVSNAVMFFELQNRLSNLIFDQVFEYLFLFVEFFLPIAFLRYWKHPIYRYAAWSSWVTALSFLTYILIGRFGLPIPLPVWFPPANLMFIALIIDGILFLFALTLRDRQIVTEKIRLEQQATANELKALRSQMNPHFIFNALNSIKSFTLDNDSERANFYLTKFSKLIRQVLENSRNEKVTLHNELETLTLYLDMEKLRVGDKFDYEIRLGEEVEQEFIEIPPMFIQPYVENAIWHGLVNKEEKGLVKIEVEQKNNCVIISIEDNGIGRKKAAEIKSKTGSSHKSFGMKINAERADLIKKLYNIDAKIIFDDLENTDKTAAGTKVTIEIPM